MKKDAKTIQVGTAWLEALRLKEPALFEHGNAWAVEAVIADRVRLTRPRTPQEARVEGGANSRKKPEQKPAPRKRKKKVAG